MATCGVPDIAPLKEGRSSGLRSLVLMWWRHNDHCGGLIGRHNEDSSLPTFTYRAYGASGNLAEGSIDAASQDAASEALWDQGLVAFKMQATRSSAAPWWQRDLFAGSN